NVQVAGAPAKIVSTTSAPTASASAPLMGVMRVNGVVGSGPELAKSAVERLCQGHADEASIRVTNGKQLAVTLKVKSASEWDKLYSQIKEQPEVAGYSLIYNVTVK